MNAQDNDIPHLHDRSPKAPAHEHLPRISPLVTRWFSWYARRYLARHLHTVRVAMDSWPLVRPDDALVLYANHPSWWDPLIALLLNDRIAGRRPFYAPIDAGMLREYPLFERLGFFGVERDELRGALAFMRTALAVTEHRGGNLWVTAQGQFADVRERPVVLRPGLSRLASRMQDGLILPVAAELVFWTERRPEALVRFGEPIDTAAHRALSTDDWQVLLTRSLERTMNTLADAVISRNEDSFVTILEGKGGVGFFYDLWRRVKALCGGDRLDARHHSSAVKRHV